ncbi:DUF192 domain-containing protein [Allorhizobium sp. BGMRC 0089]|uniref:DUF192 domain-containing protein n=1 Tax=Allorhizobium sonneratiae TaxID=2934936 RepID=UPI0020331F89|nr:DUF192 domain-containing protein [Allorhizobium sonneratiae]MCM2293751.1 DUF192 domain-containing protein [Allorhizobium sonneratiae]
MFLTVRSAFMALFLTLIFPILPAMAAPGLQKGVVSIETAKGVRHDFHVEYAIKPADRERGLMQRTTLPPDQGMIFDFGESRQVIMWMKDTPLPLDMLFIDAKGRITRIAERTTPFSEDLIPSNRPVRYVLEINGGRAHDLGIAAGDRIVSGLSAGKPGQ